jgi:hypothetical protein
MIRGEILMANTSHETFEATAHSVSPDAGGRINEIAATAYEPNPTSGANPYRASEETLMKTAQYLGMGNGNDFEIVDGSASGGHHSSHKEKFRPASQGDPMGEVQQRILDGMKRTVEDVPDHKTSRWADGAVTRVDHHDQSVTYMDPSGDAVRQNSDGSMVYGQIKNPATFDGKSSDPQLELERRVHNGNKSDYEKTESPDGRSVNYKFDDGTSLAMDRMTGKLTYTDKNGNKWTREPAQISSDPNY